ncbi:hypothetical protein GCM10022222_67460 [Amycolatopsis ultiminotia]|uniref:Transposase n=1 Tax=Amycolatopsis ultiminotia TaxID=543629 RepID=A0ABP6Y0T5_9PSEU
MQCGPDAAPAGLPRQPVPGTRGTHHREGVIIGCLAVGSAMRAAEVAPFLEFGVEGGDVSPATRSKRLSSTLSVLGPWNRIRHRLLAQEHRFPSLSRSRRQ